jgi:nitrate reductase gamma subunit
MHQLYNIITGPLLWAAFILFLGGMFYRLISTIQTARKKEPSVISYFSFPHALRSILHWIVPFASTNMRLNPVTTVVSFVFHICLLAAPLFLFAHIILVKESWGFGWPYLPNAVATTMSILVILACLFFLGRRIFLPEVRYLTTPSDYLILGMVAAPFITGLWSHHHFPGYPVAEMLHMFSGEILLAAIPFTRLRHMFLFPLTRGYMGSEFGAVRHAKDW